MISMKTLRLAAFALFATGAPLAPALAQEPTPAQVAAAGDVLAASGMSKSFDILVAQMMVRLEQTLNQSRPELQKDLAVVLNGLEVEFMKQQEEIQKTAQRILAKRMSEKDLKDTAIFFNSPAGKKYVESQPAILDELAVAAQGWSEKLSQFMMTRVREEMKKKGHQI